MECLTLYVLTTLSINAEGNLLSRNVGVTFDIFEAEGHQAKGLENDFETFPIFGDWQEHAEQSRLIRTMRDFRDLVTEMQDAALR